MTYKWHCNARIDQLVTGKMIIVENNTMNYFVSFITSKFCWLHATVERIWTRHAGVCCCCLQGVISTWTFALKEWTSSPLFASCRCCPAFIEYLLAWFIQDHKVKVKSLFWVHIQAQYLLWSLGLSSPYISIWIYISTPWGVCSRSHATWCHGLQICPHRDPGFDLDPAPESCTLPLDQLAANNYVMDKSFHIFKTTGCNL